MANYNAIRYNVPYSDSGAGSLRLIKTLTASSSGTLSFVDGTSDVVLDSTYKEYLFIFNNIHPATDTAFLSFNMSVDSGSNYNVTKTTTLFQVKHNEAGDNIGLSYNTSYDLAQSTGFQYISSSLGNANDECGNGILHLFNPSSTTFVKHFMSKSTNSHDSDGEFGYFSAGYGNTTSAVDAVQFKMSSGNIDAGTIQLFGVL